MSGSLADIAQATPSNGWGRLPFANAFSITELHERFPDLRKDADETGLVARCRCRHEGRVEGLVHFNERAPDSGSWRIETCDLGCLPSEIARAAEARETQPWQATCEEPPPHEDKDHPP